MSSAKTLKVTIEDAVRRTLTDFCSVACQQLSTHLKDKHDVEISPEEIGEVFEVAYKTPSTPGPAGSTVATVLPNMGVPDYFKISGDSPAKPKAKGGRSKKASSDAPTCSYKMTRGKNSGQNCPNKIAGDSVKGGDRFCKSCLKKAAVQAELANPEDKATLTPPTAPGSTIPVAEEVEEKSTDLEAYPIEGREGFFKEAKYGFTIQQTLDRGIIAHSIEVDGKERPLNDAEKKIAIEMGLSVVETKETKLPPVMAVPRASSS